jgi:anti-sigma regulatory factor (Ser/Thr protein kinase)
MLEVPVRDEPAVAEARRRAVAAAARLGFDELHGGRVAIVATELASNLVKHGTDGRLLVDASECGVELLALDRGPGMADVARCLADGYSSAGTSGNGLGAARRLSLALEIGSWPGKGTAVYARVGPAGTAPPPAAAGVVVAKPGEDACGDAWAWHEDPEGRTLFVVDGLGHGTEAAIAANEAVRQFQRSRGAAPVDILQAVHAALRHTRGGAVAVARIVWASGTVVYAGLGNIAGTLIAPGGQQRRMVSHNGTAGHNARKIQAFEYPSAGGPLIMHSDGIASAWSLEPYPGLAQAHPMLLAGILYRDHARGRDDATVVACPTTAP